MNEQPLIDDGSGNQELDHRVGPFPPRSHQGETRVAAPLPPRSAVTFVALGALLYVAGLAACLFLALTQWTEAYQWAVVEMDRPPPDWWPRRIPIATPGRVGALLLLFVPFALPAVPLWPLHRWLAARAAKGTSQERSNPPYTRRGRARG